MSPHRLALTVRGSPTMHARLEAALVATAFLAG